MNIVPPLARGPYGRVLRLVIPSALLLLVPLLGFAQESGADPASLQTALQETTFQIDRLWVLVAAAMVMFMQVGFLMLEVGCVGAHHAEITAVKNVVDWVIVAFCFFWFGWGVMFGHTGAGVIGTDFIGLSGDVSGAHPTGLWIHFLFQLAFAGTAATIVSGAMAGRTNFVAYMVISAAMSVLIYPVVGHWIWGNSFFAGNRTLLSGMGFVDFAGSSAVHSVGGWTSLVGVLLVGPRIGRFGPTGEVRSLSVTGLQWTGMGVLCLWFSWWAFNGGSTLALNADVGYIINNTNLAAAAGGLVAMAHCAFFQKKRDLTLKFLGGILVGLVGITANCHMVTPLSAVVIGGISGILCNLATDLLLHLKIDDPVGAIPVHLVGGIWGTLCVGLFGKQSALDALGHTRLQQIGVQLLGIAVVALWVCGVSVVVMKLLKSFVGLRVSALEETEGFDIGGVVAKKPKAPALDEATLQEIMSAGLK